MSKKNAVLVILAALSLGCLFVDPAWAQKKYPVGAFWPMTGPQAYYGRVMSHGALTGIDQINAEGGVEGHKLELIITDFKNVEVNLAVTGVQKMISIDRIPVVLASFSATSLGVQPICERAKVLMINGGAYSPNLVNKPYLHTIRMAQHQMVPPGLKFYWKQGIRKLAVLYISDPAGEVPAKQYIEPIWKKMGGTIVAMEPHQPGLTDFSAFMARIKAANPDALYDISTGQDQAYVVKGAREMGMKIPIVVPDWNPADFNPIVGDLGENVYVVSDFFDRESTDPKTVKFVKGYEEKWKEPADFYAANYYDAVYHIVPELIRRVVKSGGNPLDGEQLEKAIWTDPTFQTVYGGTLKLNRDGSVDKPVVVFKLEGGKLKVMEKVAVE
jgi:branched-chain amino acid transport system substrate-binding protein